MFLVTKIENVGVKLIWVVLIVHKNLGNWICTLDHYAVEGTKVHSYT
jgi:hypothetical protein